jgi:hypothetical protein
MSDDCWIPSFVHHVFRIYDVMVAPNLYGDIISYDCHMCYSQKSDFPFSGTPLLPLLGLWV